MRADLRKQDLHHGRVPLGRREVQRRSPTTTKRHNSTPCPVWGTRSTPLTPFHRPRRAGHRRPHTPAHPRECGTTRLRACVFVPVNATVDARAMRECGIVHSARARSRKAAHSGRAVRRADGSARRQVLGVLTSVLALTWVLWVLAHIGALSTQRWVLGVLTLVLRALTWLL